MAKILIVEDEIIVAWDIKETLEKLGHTVVEMAVSGAEAIGSAANDSPDLVLMDIRLEGEMDGIAAGDEIYHQLRIPVVYLTAHADELTLARATKTDPFGYVVKPFQSQSLQSTIKVALQRHQVEESARLTQACLTDTLTSIGDGIITTDRQGLVTFINPIAAEMTGWSAAAAMGIEIDRVFRLTAEVYSTEIENPCLRSMWLKQPVRSPAQCWLVPKDGTQIPVSDIATPIINVAGQVVGSIVIFQNNTEKLTAEMDLWERNQDLEFFQLNLISQLQTKTSEHDQAIACIQVLSVILSKIHTVRNEVDLLQIAIEKLGIAIDADYCWCAIHDPQNTTATIISEYINQERHFYPTSKIWQKIDVSSYSQFYAHLAAIESWINPPAEITPQPYLDFLTGANQILICPIIANPPNTRDKSAHRHEWEIGEVGIVTTGKQPWTPFQTYLITQTLSYAVQLYRQRQSGKNQRDNLDSIALSIEWLNSLKDDFSNSIADVDRDLHLSAEMLQQQIYAFNPNSKNLSVARHNQFLHQELVVNLASLEAEWQRQFQLIDILIEVQTNGVQPSTLPDSSFDGWINSIIQNCSSIATQYDQDFSYQISEQLKPFALLFPFATLELMLLELFHNACKYTPPTCQLILHLDLQNNQLQLSIFSLGISLSAQTLETMFTPFAHNSSIDPLTYHEHSAQRQRITGLGLSLVKKLITHLGGDIQAANDDDSTRLILTLPILGNVSSG
jgi:PAS domain S-box-containing protein